MQKFLKGVQGETFPKKFPPAFFLILIHYLRHSRQQFFNLGGELELGARAVEVVVLAVNVVIEVTVDMVGKETRSLLDGDDERGERQKLALSCGHAVAKLLEECGGESLKLCKIELNLVEINFILGSCRGARAHRITKIVKERAGHNGVKVDNANTLARFAIQKNVVELGIVVRYAKRYSSLGNAIHNRGGVFCKLAHLGNFFFHALYATCAVGGNGLFKLGKTVGRIVKARNGFGKAVCRKIGKHTLKTTERVGNLGKIGRTFGNLKADHILNKVVGAEVVAILCFVVWQSLFGGQKGQRLAGRISTCFGDFLSQMRGNCHNVAHNLCGIFENVCVDALQNNTRFAIYQKSIVDVAVAVRKCLGINAELLEYVCDWIHSLLHPFLWIFSKMYENGTKPIDFAPRLCYDYIIIYPNMNRYMEMDIKPLKTAKNSYENHALPLSDCGIARSADILAFHCSLDRHFDKDHNFSGECHPFYELVYVEEGTVGITADEEVHTLSGGQILLHSPNEFHRIWSEFGSAPHVRNLSFFAAAVPSFGSRVVQLSDTEQAELSAICTDVARGITAGDRALLNETRVRLELWFLQIAKKENDVTEQTPLLPSALRYAEIVGILHTNLHKQLSAGEIAQLCNISLSALKKIFTRYAGMGVSRYFTEMKMRYAAQQLQAGMRVGEVAALLGYFDQNYFSTVFRRVMGSPPGTYRGSEKKCDTRIERKENTKMKFITVQNYEQMSRQAANIISAQVIMKPQSVLGLATGSSPLGTYRQLIEWYKKGDLDFSSVTSVNLDEYIGLDGSHDQSYRYFMQTNFFHHINIRRENTFVPNGCAEDLEKEGADYDARIESFGGIDLQLLGIGLDGHIGFNEPAPIFEKATHVVDLHESTIKANARFFEKESDVPRKAITMGMGAIMQAKKVLLIANGKAKKDIVERAFFGPITPEVPASILQLHPDLTVVFSEE